MTTMTVTKQGYVRALGAALIAGSLVGAGVMYGVTPTTEQCSALTSSTGIYDGALKVSDGGRVDTTCGSASARTAVHAGDSVIVHKALLLPDYIN